MDGEQSLGLTDREIAAWFLDPLWAQRFPPILTLEEAADLLREPQGTVRDWRSRGLLKSCCRRVGRKVRFVRDRLIKRVFNEGFEHE